MLAPRPTPKLEDHPSSAVHGCLFSLFTATLHIGGHSSICNLRTHHVVVTGTHIHGGCISYMLLLVTVDMTAECLQIDCNILGDELKKWKRMLKTPLKINFLCIDNKEIYCIFKTSCVSSVLFSAKCHLFHNFLFFCQITLAFFIKHPLKFKYQCSHLELRQCA